MSTEWVSYNEHFGTRTFPVVATKDYEKRKRGGCNQRLKKRKMQPQDYEKRWMQPVIMRLDATTDNENWLQTHF